MLDFAIGDIINSSKQWNLQISKKNLLLKINDKLTFYTISINPNETYNKKFSYR